jgi:hypothetical protein
MEEHLSSECEALSQNPSSIKRLCDSTIDSRNREVGTWV